LLDSGPITRQLNLVASGGNADEGAEAKGFVEEVCLASVSAHAKSREVTRGLPKNRANESACDSAASNVRGHVESADATHRAVVGVRVAIEATDADEATVPASFE
jgi:hypothetical protein